MLKVYTVEELLEALGGSVMPCVPQEKQQEILNQCLKIMNYANTYYDDLRVEQELEKVEVE